MSQNLREIIHQMNRLNLMHRMYIYKASLENQLYFGQHPILEYVSDHEDCSQRELADALGVSPPSIANSIKRLQKKGLLEKRPDPNDLRAARLRITESGLQRANQCRADFDRVDRQMFAGFSAQEQSEFYRYLERLTDNLTTEADRGKSLHILLQEAHRLQECKEEAMDD